MVQLVDQGIVTGYLSFDDGDWDVHQFLRKHLLTHLLKVLDSAGHRGRAQANRPVILTVQYLNHHVGLLRNRVVSQVLQNLIRFRPRVTVGEPLDKLFKSQLQVFAELNIHLVVLHLLVQSTNKEPGENHALQLRKVKDLEERLFTC